MENLQCGNHDLAPTMTSPNHDLAPVMFVGVGKSFIAERMLFDGDMPCGDRVRLAKSTVSLQNLNFSSLITVPFSAHVVR